jgi:hypothetical protein
LEIPATVSFRVTSRFTSAGLLFTISILLAAAAPAAAQDALAKMRAQYAAETNPVAKARILAKLGPREMNVVRSLVSDGDEDKALAALGQYRDEVRDTTRTLLATGIDASRHSNGFKELQISLRDSIRRLDDLILSSHQDVRPEFRAVHSDLESDENSLIDALFPVQEPKHRSAK